MSKLPQLPFLERKAFWRGPLDLSLGSYPRFLFGGDIGKCLPVFHFHDATPGGLEPYFRYLAENGYRTVTSDAIARFVLDNQHPGPRTVALCFDDAWGSLWTVVSPLLTKYDLMAITYVSPGRINNHEKPRARGSTEPNSQPGNRESLFCSWPELKTIAAEGRIDIQAHGHLHARVAAGNQPVDFLKPGQRMHPHALPLIDTPDGTRLATAKDLGAPVYITRSRLSEVRRWIAREATARCLEHVQGRGGPDFFKEPDWRGQLEKIVQECSDGRWENADEQENAVREDLAKSKSTLESQLGKKVDHMCFPWAIAGRTSLRLAAEVGFKTAFSDRLGGYRAVRAGDHPHQLMRLKHQYIFCLPGNGRSWMFGKAKPGADMNAASITVPLPP